MEAMVSLAVVVLFFVKLTTCLTIVEWFASSRPCFGLTSIAQKSLERPGKLVFFFSGEFVAFLFGIAGEINYIYIYRISVYCNAFELVQFGAESLLLHVGLNIFEAH